MASAAVAYRELMREQSGHFRIEQLPPDAILDERVKSCLARLTELGLLS